MTRTPRARRSLHSVEGFLEKLQVARLAELFPGAVDPFFLERVLGWSIALVKDAEDTGEG